MIILGIFISAFVFASTTDGTVSGYAWSENVGWINFGATNGNIHITDSVLTGSAWSENVGWIKLDPTTSGVKNTSDGVLSGYAWSENVGWINFSGVSINSSGEFTGMATGGTNTGRINFDCTYCNVATDWRPQSQRQTIGGGGGGLPSEAYNIPKDNLSIVINNGENYTKNKIVVLKFQAGSDIKKIAVSNFSDFRNAVQEDFVKEKQWQILDGDGEKVVYVKFFTEYGQSSEIFSDKIIFDITAPEITITNIKKEYNIEDEVIIGGTSTEPNVGITISILDKYGFLQSDNHGQWLTTFGKIPAGNYNIELTPKDSAGNVGKIITANFLVSETAPVSEKQELPVILEKIKTGLEFLIPKFGEPEKIEPVKVITVPKTAPISLKTQWDLLPTKILSKFVLSPLPKDLAILTEKFAELDQTFKDVGVSKITDLQKIKSAKLILPGLSEAVAVEGTDISSAKFSVPKGIPIANLTTAAKNRIPTDIVFAKIANGFVDLNIVLSLNNKGKTEQKISTITGKPLELVVRVDSPVKSVIGYIIFKSRNAGQISSVVSLKELTASLSFSSPDFAEIFNPNKNLVAVEGEPSIEVNSILKNKTELEIETRLVLDKFSYQDIGDGVFTATVNAPVVDGEYEIITVIDYLDESIESKELKLITVVDPEGYIYEKDGDKETRVGGAIASIYWLNPETKQYELWPAKNYQQENPQTTDVRGTYSFLVPEGYYYLTVTAPGYLEYDGKPFEVKEGSGVHINIEMKNKYWWTKIIDWKTILLIVITLMLLYNFYKDKIRDKIK